MGWFAEIWERWFAMREIERIAPVRPQPQYPPGVKRFLKAVAALNWRASPFDYDEERWWTGTIDEPDTGERTRYNLEDFEEREEFMRRIVASISDEELRRSLEFLRQPPWDWMEEEDKESWDLWAGELLFEFWREQPDELLLLIIAELEYPGIRGTILNSLCTSAVIPHLLPWVERAAEFSDEEAGLLIDAIAGYEPESLTKEQMEMAQTALAKMRTVIPATKTELHRKLDIAEAELSAD